MKPTRKPQRIPKNTYEIAEGVFVSMKKPTYGLQKRFQELDEPVQELFKEKRNGKSRDATSGGFIPTRVGKAARRDCGCALFASQRTDAK